MNYKKENIKMTKKTDYYFDEKYWSHKSRKKRLNKLQKSIENVISTRVIWLGDIKKSLNYSKSKKNIYEIKDKQELEKLTMKDLEMNTNLLNRIKNVMKK
jgi:hypothetical protein